MAKIVKKKKKKKLQLTNFTAFFFLCSLTLYLMSSLFLRTVNNSLSSRKQEYEDKIAQLETENDAAKVAIRTLTSKDRVESIVSSTDLSMNQDNIVTITAGNDGE